MSFDKKILNKLSLSLDFLYQHQDKKTGWLPNYGNNDGALFFPLNSDHYRDFKPQLQAFGLLLGHKLYDKIYEDAFWFGLMDNKQRSKPNKTKSILNYETGGFYGFRDAESLTSIRCGKYQDRPSHADALNIDIWNKGVFPK